MKEKEQEYEWGDQIDIVALSELYNVRVRIFEYDKLTKKLHMSFDQGEHEKSINLPLILLSKHNQKYYNIIFDPQRPHKRPLYTAKSRQQKEINITSIRDLWLRQNKNNNDNDNNYDNDYDNQQEGDGKQPDENNNDQKEGDGLNPKQREFKKFFEDNMIGNNRKDFYYKKFTENGYNDIEMMIHLDKDTLINDIKMNAIHAKMFLDKIKIFEKSYNKFKNWMINTLNMEEYFLLFANSGIITMQIFYDRIKTHNDIMEIIGYHHESDSKLIISNVFLF